MNISLDKVLSSDRLPSLPVVATRVIQLAQEPEPDFDEVVRVVKSDPAISARMLKTANSALFGIGKRVSSIESAVPLMGTTLVKAIVLSFSLARTRVPFGHLTKFYQRHWLRSLTQAVTAESLAIETRAGDPAEFFIVGLLQDIGELALLNTFPDAYAIGCLNRGPRANQCEAETRHFGFSHADARAELCQQWGLGELLVAAVSSHHKPLECIDASDPQKSSLQKASVAASHCADFLEAWQTNAVADRTVADQVLNDAFALSQTEADDLLLDVPLRVGEISAVFDIDVGIVPTAEDLIDSSKTILAGMAIQSQLEAMAASRRAEPVGVTQLETDIEQPPTQVNHDPLAAPCNRRFIATVLRAEMQHCRERQLPMGVLLVDLDNFKGKDDSHERVVGDVALSAVSRELHASMQERDVVIRSGDNEFLMILIDLTHERLLQFAESACQSIQELRLDGDENARLISSVGGVYVSPGPTVSPSPEDVFRELDRAMSAASCRGGDRVQLHQMFGDCLTNS